MPTNTGADAVLEGLRSPNVFNPKTIGEAVAVKLKNPNACFWAGGTYIMSRPGFYPNPSQRDIISLNGVADLTKVYHSDRFIEVGSMVTIQQLANMGGYLFSHELNDAIAAIGSSVIRNQATVGGSLCTSSMRFSLCCILATLNAQVELKMVSKSAPSKWMPITKLYDRKGSFVFEGEALLTKIRIPTDAKQFQVFKSIGLPMQKPNESVVFGLQYSINQANIMLPSMCMVFPSSCFYMSQDFDNLLASINLPLTADRMLKISKRLVTELKSASLNASPLQLERASRLFESVLSEINTMFLAG